MSTQSAMTSLIERVDACPSKRIEAALDIIAMYGGIDGDHHKAWVIDQVTRARSLATSTTPLWLTQGADQLHEDRGVLLDELERVTGEREKRDEHGQTPADYEDLGQSFLEEYYSVQDDPAMKDFICADSPVEIISHLLNAVAEAKAQMRTPADIETEERCKAAIKRAHSPAAKEAE